MCDQHPAPSINRRHLALVAASATATFGANARLALAQPARAADTPDAALALLVEGNARYVAGQPRNRDLSFGRAARAAGQAPFAAILGCADSRVAPEIAFDRDPGDLFVVRVAGNFVTSEGLGSLEFGAAVLGTRVILVLGHTSCGAVDATVAALQSGNALPGNIAGLVRAMKPGIEPALNGPESGLAGRALAANVNHAVRQLRESSPILTELIGKNQLRVAGGIYDLATGTVALI